MKEKIYILLPVHNRISVTADFIQCLNKQNYSNYQLLLIDDGSTDGTAEYVKDHIKNLSVISGNGNLWWAGSLNAGIKALQKSNLNKEDIILIINDDVLIQDNFLHTGLGLMNSMRDMLLLAQYRDQGTDEIKETGTHVDFVKLRFGIASSKKEINCLSTRGLFLSWGSLKKIGLFRSRMLPHYASDYEFTIRAYKMGFRLITHPSLSLIANPQHTGLRQMITGTFNERIRCLFSRRYVNNPIYWTNFVILICPWYAIAPNIMKVWAREILSLFKLKKIKPQV